MLIGAFADLLQADQTFPLQIAAAVERRAVGFDHFIDKGVNGGVDLFYRRALREGRATENPSS